MDQSLYRNGALTDLKMKGPFQRFKRLFRLPPRTPKRAPDLSAFGEPPVLSAYALGTIEGRAYTNSLEAWMSSLRQGIKVFEIDLCVTADDQVVAFHPPMVDRFGIEGEISRTTLRNFKKLRYHGKYTPLDLNDVMQLMKRYTDTYLIVDIKENVARRKEKRDPKLCRFICEKMVERAASCSGALDRIIPYVNERYIDAHCRVYDFPYKIWVVEPDEHQGGLAEELKKAYRHGVNIFNHHESFFAGDLQASYADTVKAASRYQIKIQYWGHPNSAAELAALAAQGVWLFHVDLGQVQGWKKELKRAVEQEKG